jgi:nucleoside-diphosphate-sugar epimerase
MGKARQAVYLVTGGAGFIGSHLVEALVSRGERVRIVDNFSTGRRENLAHLVDAVEIFEGDIVDLSTVLGAMKDVRYVLHQAAVASVEQGQCGRHAQCAVGCA